MGQKDSIKATASNGPIFCFFLSTLSVVEYHPPVVGCYSIYKGCIFCEVLFGPRIVTCNKNCFDISTIVFSLKREKRRILGGKLLSKSASKRWGRRFRSSQLGKISIYFHSKNGHEKTPKPLWYRGFPVRYLFWSHNMVTETITHLSKHI